MGLQLILVAIVIVWPDSVTAWLDRGPAVDPSTIKIEVPGFGGEGGMGLPALGGGGPALPGLAPPAPPALPATPPPMN